MREKSPCNFSQQVLKGQHGKVYFFSCLLILLSTVVLLHWIEVESVSVLVSVLRHENHSLALPVPTLKSLSRVTTITLGGKWKGRKQVLSLFFLVERMNTRQEIKSTLIFCFLSLFIYKMHVYSLSLLHDFKVKINNMPCISTVGRERHQLLVSVVHCI